ncbi:Rhomboid family protein [Rubripirellula obstinata]|uniref:Rhomboid family protein n=1 Tax=Rubripirellula obstinata TaxID=406547 RepID=A0A5B1CR83_9BACT|nr:rhomboid family intramembrane serine protease [Rubripirellula obstinata]KAA1262369.1 Rhomboid family protein [Rubripirellula obstinata]
MPKQTYPVFTFLLAMWLVYFVDLAIPADLTHLGLLPRSLRGLLGIVTAPFLHGGLGHLIGNTIPLAILMSLTIASRHRAWMVIVAIILISGCLLWVVGRSANHVGASGLVFGLCTFLITVGIRERKLASLGIAILVIFLFGTTLIWGVVPSFGSQVSWDGHLCGAVAGLAVGIFTTQKATAFF